MLHEAHRTRAPSACSVSMSTAVWMVICSEPVMRAPRNGWVEAYSPRIAIRPGISVSAMRISLRPQSASDRSATWKSADFMEFGTADIDTLPVKTERRNDNGAPNQSKVCERRYFLAEPGLSSWGGSQRSSAGQIIGRQRLHEKCPFGTLRSSMQNPERQKGPHRAIPFFDPRSSLPLRPLRQRFYSGRAGRCGCAG